MNKKKQTPVEQPQFLRMISYKQEHSNIIFKVVTSSHEMTMRFLQFEGLDVLNLDRIRAGFYVYNFKYVAVAYAPT